MPKWGAGEVYEQTLPADLNSEGQPRPGASLTKGQILWLRGITRLQTQVSFHDRLFIIFASIFEKPNIHLTKPHMMYTNLALVFVLVMIFPESQ